MCLNQRCLSQRHCRWRRKYQMKVSEIVPLNELFQAPVAYRWEKTSDRKWQGEFEVNGLTFEVFFEYQYSLSQKGQRVFTLDFIQGDAVHDNTGKTGAASVRVFATVVAMLKEFVAKMRPTEVLFHGKAGEKDRLYSKMWGSQPVVGDRVSGVLQGAFKQLGYDLSQTSDGSEYKTYHVRQIKQDKPADSVNAH
jgi:hypothetical protein